MLALHAPACDLNAGRNLYFLFSGFRRRRFGLFCSCGFAAFWAVLGSDPAGVSVFSALRLPRPFLVFRGFRRQRFGLFCACGFAAFWAVLGSDPAGVSVFSALRLTRL